MKSRSIRLGFELIDPPVAIDVPDGVSRRLALQGQTQGRSSERRRRGDPDVLLPAAPRGRRLPEWLAKLATAAHSLSGVKLYVVVLAASPTFEKSCKIGGCWAARAHRGSGVQRRSSTSTQPFRRPSTSELKEGISAARRDLETKRRSEAEGVAGAVRESRRADARYGAGRRRSIRRGSRTPVQDLDRSGPTDSRRDSMLFLLIAISRALDQVIKDEIERGPTLDDDV